MPRNPAPTKAKNFEMDLDLLDGWEEARLNARRLGIEEFPRTLKDFLNQAARESLENWRKRISSARKAPRSK